MTHPAIEIVYDEERGCGTRVAVGMYLRSDGGTFACGRLPIPLDVCPCCNQGIKPTRGFSWVSPAILDSTPLCSLNNHTCESCPINQRPKKFGLMFAGSKHYKYPENFIREVMRQGVSKRIAQIPNDLVVGETIVLIGHREAVLSPRTIIENGQAKEVYTPGVIMAFIPQRVEYIVTGKETNDEIEALIKRGLTPVKVMYAGQEEPEHDKQQV